MAGPFDLYVSLAVRYQWTPDQVDALDPDFIEQLLAYQEAEAEETKRQQARADRNARPAGESR